MSDYSAYIIKEGKEGITNRHLATYYYFTKQTRGKLNMKIEFQEWKEIEREGRNGPFKMIEVTGKGIGGPLDGQDVTKTFFKSIKDAYQVVKDASPGDHLDLEIKKEGNYYNVKGVTKSEEDVFDRAIKENKETLSPPTLKKDQEIDDRKGSLLIAVNIIRTCIDNGITDWNEMQGHTKNAFEIANEIRDYVRKKGEYAFNGADPSNEKTPEPLSDLDDNIVDK